MTKADLLPILTAAKDMLTVQQACERSGRERKTIGRWCKRYGIGKRRAGVGWLIDPDALAMVALSQMEALEAYLAGDTEHPALIRYRKLTRT